MNESVLKNIGQKCMCFDSFRNEDTVFSAYHFNERMFLILVNCESKQVVMHLSKTFDTQQKHDILAFIRGICPVDDKEYHDQNKLMFHVVDELDFHEILAFVRYKTMLVPH